MKVQPTPKSSINAHPVCGQKLKAVNYFGKKVPS